MTSPQGGQSTAPSNKSLNRQDILEEDEYTAALSHIIARDFFPSLVHLDATNDYLDALRTKDTSLINASVRRLEEITGTPGVLQRSTRCATPFDTPYGPGPSETPMRPPHPAKRPRYDTNMSLDMFQAKYTSEDNASFTQILDDENRQRKERWGWAWEAQKRVEQQRERMLTAREKMLIEQPPAPGVREKFLIQQSKVAGLITSGTVEEATEHEPENVDEGPLSLTVAKPQAEVVTADVLAPQKDTRAAGVDAWKFKTRNSLMFLPDADVSTYDGPASSSANAQPDTKVIKHANTRLEEQDATDRPNNLSAPSSPTHSRVEAAISGTPYRPKAPLDSFSLVPHVPSPSSAEMGPSAMKQLMTWGTLNATPRILSQSEDSTDSILPPNTFRISAPSNREALSHKLSASAAKSLRAKAGLTSNIGRTPLAHPVKGGRNSGTMAPPNWTPRKADAPGNLTPAAKRLLDRTTMGTAATRRADVMGKMARWGGNSRGREADLQHVRWTPTPSSTR
ncbi:nuclear protein DGCR14 [Pisolithus marmoratus]|nr:nuclear protein DGCR14 [Pisolithus marmoratus]